jgi:hypothetical protein
MQKPNLTLACELEPEPLKELFANQELIDDLKALNASISLGILDFSPERIEVVRQLNKAGIPVTAWLLLPKEQGYWFNRDNSFEAIARYGQFKTWTAKNKLRWAAIGLDIEPDIRAVQEFMKDRQAGFNRIVKNAVNSRRNQLSLIDYRTLVAQIRLDGYFVESYQIPFIVDERKAGSTLIQSSFGLVDLQVDREVLMLYSSFIPKNGVSILWSYAPDAQGIGIGSTGGGVELMEGAMPTLDWQAFKRDLLLAKQKTDSIFIFSLEGCVRQNFIKELVNFDWEETVIAPIETADKIDRLRRVGRGLLWVSAHPWLAFGGLFGLAWLLYPRRRCR